MRVVMAGCGNMGFAMLTAWLDSGKLQATDCLVVEPNEALRGRVSGRGVSAFSSIDIIPGNVVVDLIVFAVKPQVMAEIVPAYRRFTDNGATVLSIAAGIKSRLFEKLLGENTPVIRCMPNTPAAIGAGMMVVHANEALSDGMKNSVNDLLAANGAVTTIDDEGLMDAVTAVSGSGPAYVFHFIECLTAAAQAAGLDDATAALLARQTVLGAAQLAAASAETPARLREQVTSPNGTTAAALAVLMGDERLKKLVVEAVDAARLRSIELGK